MVAGLLVLGIGATPVTVASYDVRTPHYDVSTDISEPFAQVVGEHMESIYGAYALRFQGYELKVHERFQVKVFAQKEDYYRAVPEQLRGSTGAFVSSLKLLAAYKEGRSDEDVFRTLYHEGFHQFMFSCIARNAPLWVNEGLAEYFSEASWNGSGFTTGQVPPMRLKLVQDALREGSHIPLQDLMAMKSEDWLSNVRAQQTAASLQYCEAWSVVHFMVHAEGGRYRPRLLGYLKLISDGTDEQEAFRQSFGEDMEGLERAWTAYVMKLVPGPEYLCRRNLEALCQLIIELYGDPREFKGLPDLRRSLLNPRSHWRVEFSYGETIDSRDTKKVKALFKCPFDRTSSAISYPVLEDPETGLPVLACAHHKGVVLLGKFIPTADGGYRVEVQQLVAATLPPELREALQRASGGVRRHN